MFRDQQKSFDQIKTTNDHILPKAKQIDNRQQQIKRCIYPFRISHHKHNINYCMQMTYQYINSCQIKKFIPPKPTILSHFLRPYIIYNKFNNFDEQQLFNQNIYSIERLQNLRNHDYVMKKQDIISFHAKDSLHFDSKFQSGNLSIVSKVSNLYCLLLHSDVNTNGYTNWFYYSVKCDDPGTYKFAIMNYGKAGWAFNNGVGICYYVKGSQGWKRGGQNIQCTDNRKVYSGNHQLNNFNTLAFDFSFQQPNEQVFFSYNIPYTYTELCQFLDKIQQQKLEFFSRKLAGRSLAGNRLQIIKIGNNEANKNNDEDLPVIFLVGRSHSGQTVSSWIMQSLIQFLISNDKNAQLLRANFIFKICPMINPDGVIHGNYRCSLSGRDLNRKWDKPSKNLFPEVYYIKNQIIQTSKNRKIKMFIDLHGHTQKKNSFIYGCNDKIQPHKCRLFPFILSQISNNFEYKFCNFTIDKSKLSTARVTLYQSLKIPNVFTLQSSQFGIQVGHINVSILKKISQSIAQALVIYFKLLAKEANTTNQILEIDVQKFQQELISNQQLLECGNSLDSGSQRQPSLDNIDYEKLAKMTEKKQDRQAHRQIINKNTIIQKCKNTYYSRKYHQKVIRNVVSSRGQRSVLPKGREKVNSTLIKPSFDEMSKKKQVLKLINFSLSISEQKHYFNNFIRPIKFPRQFKNDQGVVIYRHRIKSRTLNPPYRQ